MRVISMIKADANSEADRLPDDPTEMPKMGKMAEESIKRGLIVGQGGLMSSRHGARVTFVDGAPQVTDGPFAETKELVAGFAILNVKDLDQAIEEAMKLPMKRELELRPIFESEDFPQDHPAIQKEKELRAQSKPNGKQQWMLLFEPHGESTEPPDGDVIAEMGRYNESLAAAGALVAGEGLMPSAFGARINLATREVVKGPFTNKYLICGWWTIQCDTKAEAIEWAKRVPIKTGTIEVRQMFLPPGHGTSIPVPPKQSEKRA